MAAYLNVQGSNVTVDIYSDGQYGYMFKNGQWVQAQDGEGNPTLAADISVIVLDMLTQTYPEDYTFTAGQFIEDTPPMYQAVIIAV